MTEQRRRTRRKWSEDFKRRVVAEASRPGVSAASVAQRFELNANLVFNWKRRYGSELIGGAPAFLPIEVVASAPPVPSAVPTSPVSAPTMLTEGSVEIALSSGTRVTVTGAFDPDVVVRLVRGLSS